jgi:hypothetical protein
MPATRAATARQFVYEVIADGTRLLVQSTCVKCGAETVGSAVEVQQCEANHRCDPAQCATGEPST